MRKRVVLYRAVPKDVVDVLRRHFDVTEFAAVDEGNRRAFIEALGAAHGIIGNMLKITTDLLDAAPLLEAASTISAGYDAFDVGELTRRGIVLTHTPGEVTETTADLAFALMLASARRVVELANWAKSGAWAGNVDERLFGVDVHGKTLGIVGLGRIGGALARRAALGFGMRVLYTNRQPNAQAESAYGAVRCPLDELLAQADFVCTLVPLSSETHHLIGAREFALMKSSAILINASRGPVVDEWALVDALKAGRIRGAGLDVFEREPLPAESPLYALPSVVALPHIGSATRATRAAMAQRAALNLIETLEGRAAAATVNPEARAVRREARQAQ
ncbi:2-hydroxyacid dehydrogenase [Trinickia mobilis]|uniref:2-hydroxyacid dehydrogenase n=1 Tax=Trinickia mobilis TaxID=2816356 RepID=UPI001A8C3223|nr:D-glycerate dehydrogenase [Trinickia mobilis]